MRSPWPRPMNEVSKGARPLTSIELLDAAVCREIGSEEAQPRAAFVNALSALVGRWLLVRSDAPEMDLVTVMCRPEAISREAAQSKHEVVNGDTEEFPVPIRPVF